MALSKTLPASPIHRTFTGKRIHVFDLREGYDPPAEPDAIDCPICEKLVDPTYYYGVFVTITSYLTYCSAACAAQHPE